MDQPTWVTKPFKWTLNDSARSDTQARLFAQFRTHAEKTDEKLQQKSLGYF